MQFLILLSSFLILRNHNIENMSFDRYQNVSQTSSSQIWCQKNTNFTSFTEVKGPVYNNNICPIKSNVLCRKKRFDYWIEVIQFHGKYGMALNLTMHIFCMIVKNISLIYNYILEHSRSIVAFFVFYMVIIEEISIFIIILLFPADLSFLELKFEIFNDLRSHIVKAFLLILFFNTVRKLIIKKRINKYYILKNSKKLIRIGYNFWGMNSASFFDTPCHPEYNENIHVVYWCVKAVIERNTNNDLKIGTGCNKRLMYMNDVRHKENLALLPDILDDISIMLRLKNLRKRRFYIYRNKNNIFENEII